MKILRRRSYTGEHYAPFPNAVLHLKSLFAPAFYSMKGIPDPVFSSCLACVDRPCIEFSVDEREGGTRINKNVCPTNAIALEEKTGHITIDKESCVGCGLCVMRCPVFALHFVKDDSPQVMVNRESPIYQRVDKENQIDILSKINIARRVKRPEIEAASASVRRALRFTDKSVFYPLVGNYLTAVGLPTWIPRVGDTSNRMDGIIIKSDTGRFGRMLEIKNIVNREINGID